MLAGTAMSMAGTVASAASQADNAAKQGKFQNDRYTAVANEANRNYIDQIRQSGLQSDQLDAQMTEQGLQNRAQGLAAVAGTQVSADARGVSGASVEALKNQYQAITAQNEFNLQTNRQWREMQRREEIKAIRAGAQSRISSATPGPIATQSPFAIALNLVSTGLSGYAGAGMADKQINGSTNLFGKPS
jgi:hypothetical protein